MKLDKFGIISKHFNPPLDFSWEIKKVTVNILSQFNG